MEGNEDPAGIDLSNTGLLVDEGNSWEYPWKPKETKAESRSIFFIDINYSIQGIIANISKTTPISEFHNFLKIGFHKNLCYWIKINGICVKLLYVFSSLNSLSFSNALGQVSLK